MPQLHQLPNNDAAPRAVVEFQQMAAEKAQFVIRLGNTRPPTPRLAALHRPLDEYRQPKLLHGLGATKAWLPMIAASAIR